MVESRGDNVRNFVNGLVNKLILEAMDVLDDNYQHRFHVNCAIPNCPKCKDRKSRNPSLRVPQGQQKDDVTLSCQGDQVRSTYQPDYPQPADRTTDLWAHDGDRVNVDQRISEEIREIAQGLQGVQIGDSAMVGPIKHVTSLEIDVKRAVREMSQDCEISEVNEVPITEGQGDQEPFFQETIAAAVMEIDNEIGKTLPKNPELEKAQSENERQMHRQTRQHLQLQQQQQPQQQQQQEVSKLHSTCFLHRMIRELEDAEASQENVLKASTPISVISQERIAAWEENSEKFIRTIEGSRDENLENEIDDTFVISLVEDAPPGSVVEVEIQEIEETEEIPEIQEINFQPDSSAFPSLPSPQPLPSVPPNSSQCLGAKGDSSVLQLHEAEVEESKTKKKIHFGAKLRKFFRSAFKRGKDC